MYYFYLEYEVKYLAKSMPYNYHYFTVRNTFANNYYNRLNVLIQFYIF